MHSIDPLGKWSSVVHSTHTVWWAFEGGFTLGYARTIGEADAWVDSIWSCHSYLPPPLGQQGRHLFYHDASAEDGDSRTAWFNLELANAIHHLGRGECVQAAESFGTGLHSLQDRSAHRPFPNRENWSPLTIHPGWWDFYGNVYLLPDTPAGAREEWGVELTLPDDQWWDSQFFLDFDYHSWFGHPEQRISQDRAIRAVEEESREAIRTFWAAVWRSCPCRREMLHFP